VLAAGVLLIVCANFCFRLGAGAGEFERARVAIVEGAAGIWIVLVAHSAAFLYALLKTEMCSPLDFFLRPMSVWRPAVAALPAKAWRVWMLGWGGAAVFSAVAIVGGIRYSAIFDDWGFEKRAEASIVQAVVDQARRDREADGSLEDAMKDFTGEDADKEPEATTRTDCLIFGFIAGQRGEIQSMLLAGVVDGQLRHVGKISFENLPPETRDLLQGRFKTLERKRSFVKVPFAARWLEPVLMCRIAYAGWGEDKQMRHPRFIQVLADAKR
jgi:hypothetical protein